MSRYPRKRPEYETKYNKEVRLLGNKAWKLESEYVRRRDGKCVTCGERDNTHNELGEWIGWKALQCGHFFHRYLDFCDIALAAQCGTCNGYGKDGYAPGMPIQMKEHLERKYGVGIIQFLEKLRAKEEQSQFKNKYAGMDLTPELLERIIIKYQTKLEVLTHE